MAHIALHGLEERIKRAFPRQRHTPAVIRYADDLVVLHPDRQVVEQCQALLAEELKGMGLELKPSKTRIAHTLSGNGGAGGIPVKVLFEAWIIGISGKTSVQG